MKLTQRQKFPGASALRTTKKNDQIDLGQMLDTLWCGKIIIFFCALVALLLGLLCRQHGGAGQYRPQRGHAGEPAGADRRLRERDVRPVCRRTRPSGRRPKRIA
ncbi:MAG: hypothetical protein HUJ24_12745 [Rhodobacteraceae bacterium]|nr:hypothetical protein [Paracoccaceae bacterium]